MFAVPGEARRRGSRFDPVLEATMEGGRGDEYDQGVDKGRIRAGEPSPVTKHDEPPPAAAARCRRPASRLRNRREQSRPNYFFATLPQRFAPMQQTRERVVTAEASDGP